VRVRPERGPRKRVRTPRRIPVPHTQFAHSLLPTPATGPLTPSHPGRAPSTAKVSKSAGSCGLAGAYLLRRARAAAPGRAGAPGAAACLPGRRPPAMGWWDSGAHERAGLSRGRRPTTALSFLVGGRLWVPGVSLMPQLVPSLRSHPRPAPAPGAPRPCAPSRGRGTSETQGDRALRPRGARPPRPRPRPAPDPSALFAPSSAVSLPVPRCALCLLGLWQASRASTLRSWGPRKRGGVSGMGA
jgi:hypothetical protein